MMFEQRDLIRWFKKGFVYILLFTLISVLANQFLSLCDIYPILEQVIGDPMVEIKNIFDCGLVSSIWAFLVLPIIGGYLLEKVDNKIRK